MCEKVPDYETTHSDESRIKRLIAIRTNIENLAWELKYTDFCNDEAAAGNLTDASNNLSDIYEEVTAAIKIEQAL